MILRGFQVFYKDQFSDLDIRIRDGKVVEIGPALGGDQIYLGHGELLLPGGVDIHTHGCVGNDFSTADPEKMEEMDRYYLGQGITSVIATIMTEELPKMEQAIEHITNYMDSGKNKTILGIRMEGPFLNPEKNGAHRKEALQLPNQEVWNRLQALSANRILITDLAPELPGATECLDNWSKNTICSLAHTACNYEQAITAFSQGADHVTHLYNAMNQLHHREPGLIGAVFDQKPYAELICDGIHIHPAVIRTTMELLPRKLIMISDSMSATGLGDGQYELGGQKVFVQGGKAVLSDQTLAGAAKSLAEDLRYLVLEVGMPLETVLPAMTRIPAESIHKGKQLGRIALGARANFVIAKQNLEVIAVCYKGEFYGKDGRKFPD